MTKQTYISGKWRWKFASGAEEIIQDLLRHWDKIEALPDVEVLKSSLSRTVIAFPSTSSRPQSGN